MIKRGYEIENEDRVRDGRQRERGNSKWKRRRMGKSGNPIRKIKL